MSRRQIADLSSTSLVFLHYILVALSVGKVQLYYMIYYTVKNCIPQFLKLIQESSFAIGWFEDKSPRIRWLRPQYERQLKLGCPPETTQ